MKGCLEEVCEELGFKLKRVSSDILSPPVCAILCDDTIYLLDGMSARNDIRAIMHEYYHCKYHADCTAYRDMNSWQINRDEAQAESFAQLCMTPKEDLYCPEPSVIVLHENILTYPDVNEN